MVGFSDFLCLNRKGNNGRKVLIKYDTRGVDPSFWQKLYGYSKGKYRYPGHLDQVPGAERLARTLLAVPEGEVEKIKNFLKSQGAEFEERGTLDPSKKSEDYLRWDFPREVLRKRLESLGEDIADLGPFIRTDTERDALKDVEMYGY